MLSLETLMREAGVERGPRDRATAILAERGVELLETLISSLPERQRFVLALRYYEALHVPEIAAVLGSREAQIQETLEKAIHALSRKLEREATRKAPTRPVLSEGAGS